MDLTGGSRGLDPALAGRPASLPRGAAECSNRLAAIGGDREVDIAIAADLFGLDIDLNQPRVPGQHAVARPARKEPEPRAQHENGIGPAGMFSRSRSARFMMLRAQSGWSAGIKPWARLLENTGICARSTRSRRSERSIRAEIGEPGPASEQDRRALCGMEPFDGGLDGLRRWAGPRGRARSRGPTDRILVHLRERDIDRDLQIDGARPATGRDAQRLRDLIRNPLDLRECDAPIW